MGAFAINLDPNDPRFRLAPPPAALGSPAPDAPKPMVRLTAPDGGGMRLMPAETAPGGAPMARIVPDGLSAPAPASLDLGGGAPDLGAPAAGASPALSQNAPGSRLLADQGNLARLQRSGSGVDQIAHPVDDAGNPTGQPVGFGRRLLSVLGHTGDIALSALAPGVAALTPGTTLHNRVLQAQTEGRIGQDEGELQKGAQLQQEQAQTALTLAQPQFKAQQLANTTALNESRIDHYGAQDEHMDAQNTNLQDQYHVNLKKAGYAVDEKDPTGQTLRPLRYEEMSPVQQATEDLKHSQGEQAEAGAALKKAQNDPSSPAYRLAKSRVDVANRNATTAQQRLSLYGQSLDMRRENMNANLYGTGPDGQPIAGAPQLEGDDGQLHTVGLRAAANAEKQQGKVVSFNDLQGSVAHARAAINALHATGGSFNDPGVIAALHDPTSMVGKYVNGVMVKGNLSDQQVQAIGAVNQLREQIGILRSSTGGPAAEAQAQRMLATLPDAGDVQKTTNNKMDELDGVVNRLRAGAVHVTGGASVQGQPRAAAPHSAVPSAPSPQTHQFSVSRYMAANPKADPNAVRQAAQQQGFQVVQ